MGGFFCADFRSQADQRCPGAARPRRMAFDQWAGDRRVLERFLARLRLQSGAIKTPPECWRREDADSIDSIRQRQAWADVAVTPCDERIFSIVRHCSTTGTRRVTRETVGSAASAEGSVLTA